MRKNAFVAKEHIASFNEVRVILTSLKTPFPERILKELLKEHNLISNPLFIGELRKSGVLKVERKMLKFAEDKPIHYNKLQEVYSRYQKKVNEYSRKSRDKKSLARISEDKEIRAAIDFLKDRGFEIYVPTGTLYSKI